MTNQNADDSKKVELQQDLELKIKNDCVKFFKDKYYEENAEKNFCEFMKKSEKEIRKFVLQCDLDYLNSKNRPLNSFEQGIKEECERLLNEKNTF